jgi:hypothetical protein
VNLVGELSPEELDELARQANRIRRARRASCPIRAQPLANSSELERDADEYAVARTRDPLALASAICKAASAQARGLVALAGRGHARLRVGYLTDGAPPAGRPLEVTARALSGGLVALALIVTASVPLVVFAGHAPAEALAADCHHGNGHTH